MRIKFTSLLFVFAIASAGILQGCDSPVADHTTGAMDDHSPGMAGAMPMPAAGEGSSPVPGSPDCPLPFPKHRVCAEIIWNSPVAEAVNSPFQLRFWKMGEGTANGPYADPPHAVAVKLWMPAMGHGSSPVTVTPAVESGGTRISGIFDVNNVYFIMPGDWEIHVQLIHGNNRIHEESIAKIHI